MLDQNLFDLHKERALNRNMRFKSVRPTLKNMQRGKFFEIQEKGEDIKSITGKKKE